MSQIAVVNLEVTTIIGRCVTHHQGIPNVFGNRRPNGSCYKLSARATQVK